MLAGNFSAQVIAFLASPVITRLYTPQDFGAMTLVFSMVSVLLVVASLRYDLAIVLPESEHRSLILVALSIFLCVAFSLFLAMIVCLFKHPISVVSKLSASENLLWFVPVGVFVGGILQILSYWFTREKAFSRLSWNQVIIQGSAVPVKIGAGFWYGSSAGWLLAATIGGQFLAAVSLGPALLAGHVRTFLHRLRKDELMETALEFRDFPLYRCPNGVLMMVSANMPVFLLAHFFSSATVGFFGLANAVLRQPVGLVSQSMANVFYQKIAESHLQGIDIRLHLAKTTAGLAAVGAVPFCALFVAGPWIFSIIFGKQWIEAGFYVQLLSPWLFTLFICSPATQVVIVKRALRFNLVFDSVNVVLGVCSLSIAAYLLGQPRLAVLCFSLVSALLNLYYIKHAFHLAKQTA
jgi:O-antigen/teichoic acid export membrane protein